MTRGWLVWSFAGVVLGCGGREGGAAEVAPVAATLVDGAESDPKRGVAPEPEMAEVVRPATKGPGETGEAAAAGATDATDAAKVEPAPTTKPRSRDAEPTPNDKVGTVAEGFGLSLGTTAPVVDVMDSDGKVVSTGAVFGKEAALVVFYRGGWCPYCNAQLHGFAQRFGELQKRGVTVVAVSVDKAEEAAKTRASWEIPFHVWSDPKLVAHEAFKVVHQVGDEERTKLEGYGIDIEASSGEVHHKFAVPGIFLVDKAGVVRWAHVDPEYKVRPTLDQLLAVIDGAKLGE